MGANSNIEWTDVTDNIIVAEGGGWWCRMISEGCVNCYAAGLNQNSFFGGNKLPYTGQPPKLVLREDIIDGWKRQRNPKRHFVCSMTDVFGDWVTQELATTFLRGMWCAPKQTFQVLTKRPDVALDRIKHWLAFDGLSALPDNVHIGTSVENQKRADERIPVLLQIPAKVRFLSVEPLLAPIDFKYSCFNGADSFGTMPGIHLAIFGGESGPKARPCSLNWIRDGIRQCRASGVKVFVKQIGSKAYVDILGSPLIYPTNDKKGGDPMEWPEDLRVREEWPV